MNKLVDAISRRQFLNASAAGLTAVLAGSNLYAAGKCPPNVVLIMSDDLNFALGCYGDKVAQTPHIDRFADSAMRFECAYCQNPKCNPSRTSLMLGLRPESTRVVSNRDDWRQLVPNAITMPAYFRKHGYNTVRVGKIFHSTRYHDEASWSRDGVALPDLPEPRPLPDGYEKYTVGPTGRDDINEDDGRAAEAAVRTITAQRDQPLFLACGFRNPHSPLQAPDKYFDMYNPKLLPIPDVPRDDLDDVPTAAIQGDPNSKVRQGPRPPRKYQRTQHTYLACISFMDACVGRVLKAIDDSGQADNTIVLFISDHGFLRGEHFQTGKEYLFDVCARAPYLARVPGVTKPGSVCTQPTEFVDTYQTLADLCGLPEPKGLDGTSMRMLLANPTRPWKPAVFSMIDIPGSSRGNSIRTGQYRMTEWLPRDDSGAQYELYDIQNDPNEWTNLAGDPAHARTLAGLKQQLKAGWRGAQIQTN